MLLRLFLLFTILPSFELWLLFQVKEQLGLLETLWLVILTGIVGASMAKRQGLMVLQELQEQSKQGIPPTQTLVEGVLVLVGGVLLVTPGILTDAFGFSLIIPFTRRVWAPIVRSWFGKRVTTNASFQYNTFEGFTTPQAESIQDNSEVNVTVENTDKSSKSTKFSHPKF